MAACPWTLPSRAPRTRTEHSASQCFRTVVDTETKSPCESLAENSIAEGLPRFDSVQPLVELQHRRQRGLHLAGLERFANQRRGLQFSGNHRQVTIARQKDERDRAGLQDRAYGEAEIAAQLDVEHGAVEQVGARRGERGIDRQVRPLGVQPALAQEFADHVTQKEIVLRNQDFAAIPTLVVSQTKFLPTPIRRTSERARSSLHRQRYSSLRGGTRPSCGAFAATGAWRAT